MTRVFKIPSKNVGSTAKNDTYFLFITLIAYMLIMLGFGYVFIE